VSKARIDFPALAEAAREARERAYAPYSKYRVGAAILTRSGTIFTGCNVENATYGATICAERTAIVSMVAAGEREPIACAVVTQGPLRAKSNATGAPEPGSPCGICRQVLAEFALDMPILLVGVGPKGATKERRTSLGKLLPDAFRAF